MGIWRQVCQDANVHSCVIGSGSSGFTERMVLGDEARYFEGRVKCVLLIKAVRSYRMF